MDHSESFQGSPFNLEKATNTYGVQKELKRFALRSHLNQEHQLLANPDQGEILDGDLMLTNPTLIGTGEEIGPDDSVHKSRYIKETVVFVNIDSRNRQLYQEQLVPKDLNTRQYTREAQDPETGECIVEQYTADDLNLEHRVGSCLDNPIPDPFFERNCEIYYKHPYHHDPSSYEVRFPKPLQNVKMIRMVSSEIPNPFQTINPWNNLILLDIRDNDAPLTFEEECLGFSRSIALKDEMEECGLPFFLIQLPMGNYTFLELLNVLERSVNKIIQRRSRDSYENLFRVQGDSRTGKVEISIHPPKEKSLSFHWRFWFSLGIPQNRFLYQMLGFPRPFERNKDGSNKYVTVWNNLYKFPSSQSDLKNIVVNEKACNPSFSTQLVHVGFQSVRPFLPINLQPETYIYLILEECEGSTASGSGSFLDLRQPSIPIFAKIQLTVAPGETAFNTFVNSPRFFIDVPLRSLEKLSIKWVDAQGNLIHWHGLEHSFTLEIAQYLDRLAANDYSSIRGVTDPTSFTSKETVFSYNK